MNRLLTLEELYNARAYAYNRAEGDEAERELQGDEGIAKAQLAKDEARHQQEIEKIWREIEKHPLCETVGLFLKPIPLEDCNWYLALKEKYLGKVKE